MTEQAKALIDLRMYSDLVTAFVRESLTEFAAQHRHTKVSAIGLFGDGFHGTAALHADTAEHSAAFIETRTDPGSYGEDEKGKFCNNCWDFAYCLGACTLTGYPDLYDGDATAPVDVITLDGKRVRASADEGDDGLHRVALPFLKSILSSFEPFSGLLRDSLFRAGVQMQDSTIQEFWIVR
jgi:hypothetical protein